MAEEQRRGSTGSLESEAKKASLDERKARLQQRLNSMTKIDSPRLKPPSLIEAQMQSSPNLFQISKLVEPAPAAPPVALTPLELRKEKLKERLKLQTETEKLLKQNEKNLVKEGEAQEEKKEAVVVSIPVPTKKTAALEARREKLKKEVKETKEVKEAKETKEAKEAKEAKNEVKQITVLSQSGPQQLNEKEMELVKRLKRRRSVQQQQSKRAGLKKTTLTSKTVKFINGFNPNLAHESSSADPSTEQKPPTQTENKPSTTTEAPTETKKEVEKEANGITQHEDGSTQPENITPQIETPKISVSSEPKNTVLDANRVQKPTTNGAETPITPTTNHVTDTNQKLQDEKKLFDAVLLTPDTRPKPQLAPVLHQRLPQSVYSSSESEDVEDRENKVDDTKEAESQPDHPREKRDTKWVAEAISQFKGESLKHTNASLESQLHINFDKFAASVGAIKDGIGKVLEHYDQDTVKNQGDVLLHALDKKSKVPKWLRNAQDTAVEDVDEDGVTEADRIKAKERERAKKTAIDPILYANPNIAKDANYEMFYSACTMEEPGVYVWRIESWLPMDVERDPDDEGIELCSDDSYVILHIGGDDDEGKQGRKLTIYHWVGEKATIDKVACAALRARELNIYFKGIATMRREVEVYESGEFLELFDHDVKYFSSDDNPPCFRLTGRWRSRQTETGQLESWLVGEKANEFWLGGGIGTGRLYRISKLKIDSDSKGLYYSMKQVHISWPGEFNEEDVFILDMSHVDGLIWQWNGALADTAIQWRGKEIVQRILKHERNMRGCTIEITSGEENSKYGRGNLGGKGVPVQTRGRCFFDYFDEPPTDSDGPLPSRGKETKDDATLFKINIHSLEKVDAASVRKPGGPILSKSMLKVGCFVLIRGVEVFIWVSRLPVFEKTAEGKHKRRLFITSKNIRRDLAIATDLVSQIASRSKTELDPVQTVYEGFEPIHFICKFPDWQALAFNPYHSNYAAAQIRWGRFYRSPSLPFDDIADKVKSVLLSPPVFPPDDMIDDALGNIEVFVMEDGVPSFKKLPEVERGHFYTKNCYLILYTYNDETERRQKYLCYFWEGRSSKSARWWAAFLFGFYPVLERRIKAKGGEPPLRIRVTEQLEPKHFCTLFDHHIIVHSGKRSSSLDLKTHKNELYHIKNTQDWVTHTTQVPCEPKHLHSADSFILLTAEKTFLWRGKHLPFQESHLVVEVKEKLLPPGASGSSNEEIILEEGSETSGWLDYLGFSKFPCDEQFVLKYYPRGIKPRLLGFKFNTDKGGGF
eukprot:TRINITY_DN5884_c0_g1_i2.p1 TRINITY_DN5884_c0_g1~~TRINITY_DN5884_c0_g1_i2.p1  ORF type:complete len:1274 (-),score=335.47 TRINITY_DN5884_c0_g1_i2:113-3934(-)